MQPSRMHSSAVWDVLDLVSNRSETTMQWEGGEVFKKIIERDIKMETIIMV